MPIIPLKCPNCGGSLEVDSTKNTAICKYCGQPYIVKDAIVNTYVNELTINASTVNVDARKDFEIVAGKLLKYHGESREVVIPDNVKVVGENAFKDTAIVKVTLPNSLYRIDDSAFSRCTSLETIEFSDGLLQICDSAFSDCFNLKTIIIPPNVETIEREAFANCENLSNVQLNEGLISIGACAFFGCKSLTRINIPSSLERIYEKAFLGSGLVEITSNNAEKTINSEFFYHDNGVSSDDYGCDRTYWKAGKICSPYNLFFDKDRCSVISGTPLYDSITKKHDEEQLKKQQELYKQQQEWNRHGLCLQCGSPQKGIFKKICTNPSCPRSKRK